MKLQQKNEAISLRKDQGLPIKEIAKILNVAKSSISLWVRDVKLTDDQIKKLQEMNPIYNKQLRGANKRKENCKELRKKYQIDGREQAKKKEWLHGTGCMLYWAEGSKGRSSLQFVNSDPEMHKIFFEFLNKYFNKYFGENYEKIAISCNCYVNNGLTSEDIETYWLNIFNLPRSCLRKTQINMLPKTSKGYKKNKLLYGVCRLEISNVRIVQHIYGAIQEYCGIEGEKWID